MSENGTINRFTVLDWIGVVYVVANIIALFLFPRIAFTFEKMFEDFGGPLPAMTRIVLKPWFSILLGIFCTGIFSLQWVKPIKISLKLRRTVIVLSIFAASAAYALCIIGLYQPIFKMAGSI
jgi:type II secretory pathway component PulF